MTTDTLARPADVKGTTMYAVRAQHDGVSHFLVREPGNRQTPLPDGRVVNEPEVLSLGVHTTTKRKEIAPGIWEASDPTLTPDHDLEIARFQSRDRAQAVADACNRNAAGYVWYVVEHKWSPPAGYTPPPSSEAAEELEAVNAQLRVQLASLQNEQLRRQLAELQSPPAAASATVASEPTGAPAPFDPSV